MNSFFSASAVIAVASAIDLKAEDFSNDEYLSGLLDTGFFSNPAYANPYPSAPRYGPDSSYFRPDIPYAPAPSHKAKYTPRAPLYSSFLRPTPAFPAYEPKYPLRAFEDQSDEEEQEPEPVPEIVPEIVPGTEEESAASDDDHHEKSDEYDSLYPFLSVSFFD